MGKAKYLAFLGLLLSICISPGSAISPDFDRHTIPVVTLGNYEPSLLPGHGSVYGYLRADTKTFGKLTYANTGVLMVPNSPFSKWYINDTAYMIENPNAKDALTNYPWPLIKYTRSATSDDDGFFKFTNVPEGSYYVWTYVEHEADTHTIKERSVSAIGPDGEMVSVPQYRPGLKVKSDDVVIEADATIDYSLGDGYRITSFSTIGEFLCCSGEF